MTKLCQVVLGESTHSINISETFGDAVLIGLGLDLSMCRYAVSLKGAIKHPQLLWPQP